MDDAGVSLDAGSQTLVILHTSDLHANVFAWDYFKDRADHSIGLVRVASLVKRERDAAPRSLLIDTGDTIQGTPLGASFARTEDAGVHPVAVAMNAMKYDAMTVGNHEFNYGTGVLSEFGAAAAFPILGANVKNEGKRSPLQAARAR